MFTSTWNGIRVCDTPVDKFQITQANKNLIEQIDFMEKITTRNEKPNFHYFSFSEQIAFKIDPRSTWKAIWGDKGNHFPEL